MDPQNKGGVKFLVNHWGIEDASAELLGAVSLLSRSLTKLLFAVCRLYKYK